MTDCRYALWGAGTILTDGNDGGLIQHDALAFDVNQGIRSTQVNGQVVGKHATKFFKHTKG
jgi:hypothetical protein